MKPDPSLRLSRIKGSQVMSTVIFSRTALDFGYDFVLLVNFVGHPIDCVMLIMYQIDSFDFPVEEARPEFSNSIEPSLTRPNRIWLIAGQSTEFYKKHCQRHYGPRRRLL